MASSQADFFGGIPARELTAGVLAPPVRAPERAPAVETALPRAPSAPRGWPWIALVALGFVLRLTALDVQSFWYDEGGTVFVARSPDLLQQLAHDRHPPLSFLAYRAWIGLFGEGDAVLRLLPALLSCASLVLFARIARRWLGPSAGLFALALYAVSPFHVWHGQEVRMYAFLELGTLVALTGFDLLVSGALLEGALALCVGQFMALGSHYMGCLVAPLVAALLALAWRRKKLLLSHAIAGALATALGVVLWSPWVLRWVPEQLATSWGYPSKASARELLELPLRHYLIELSSVPANLHFAIYLAAAAVGAAFVSCAWFALRKRDSTAIDALVCFATPVVCALILMKIGPPSFTPKYLMPASAGTLLVVAWGTSRLPWRNARIAAIAVLLAVGLGLTLWQKRANLREDYRTACELVAEKWKPGDAVVSVTGTVPGFEDATVRHYLRERPEILASLESVEALRTARPRSKGARLHVVYRSAEYSRSDLQALTTLYAPLRADPERYRISYQLLSFD